jgi:hypothetical protein
MTERALLELPVERFLFREHLIDDARELEGDERARDPNRLAPGLGLEEGPDFRVVLDGADAGVTEGQLEVAVPALEPERWRVRPPELSAPGTRRLQEKNCRTDGKRVMPSISV